MSPIRARSRRPAWVLGSMLSRSCRASSGASTGVLPRETTCFGPHTEAAGIATRIGNHTFRATGITAYLKNAGTLEKAAAMANHASTRTTQLYDRRQDELSLDEVERIPI